MAIVYRHIRLDKKASFIHPSLTKTSQKRWIQRRIDK